MNRYLGLGLKQYLRKTLYSVLYEFTTLINIDDLVAISRFNQYFLRSAGVEFAV